jgi:hypothetical protein
MFKITFVLFYAGYIGLLLAYTTNEIWLDRVSLCLVLASCLTHAHVWKVHIRKISTPAKSIVDALDMLNKHRKNDFFASLLPNPFYWRELGEKREYLFIRQDDKSVASAVYKFFGKNWEVAFLTALMSAWVVIQGISSFKFKMMYNISPFSHDVNVHIMVLSFVPYASLFLTTYMVAISFRK